MQLWNSVPVHIRQTEIDFKRFRAAEDFVTK